MIPDDSNLWRINNLGNSLFKSVVVYVNEQMISTMLTTLSDSKVDIMGAKVR